MKTIGLMLLTIASLFAGSWDLPKETTVKDNGPRTYRFTVDYTATNIVGQIVQRQRVIGEYTRGLPGGDVIWNNVTIATANGATEPFPPAQKREFMEGFRYHKDPETFSRVLGPDFFKGFPSTSVMERTLIIDEEMIELFGQGQFAHLRLNEPYHMGSSQDVPMPDIGTFHSRDIQLVWVGKSQRNGQSCAVIEYSSCLNTVDIDNAGVNLKGRSNFWGQIWVSLATRQVEYSTLYEDVVGEMKQPGQNTPQLINVFRNGVFEPMSGK